MRYRPAKANQMIISMEGCTPALSKKLRDLRIRNFEKLYRFGVQKESELAQEKKFFAGRPRNRNAASSSNIQVNAIRPLSSSFHFDPFKQPNSSFQFDPFKRLSNSVHINAVRQPPRRFSNLTWPLSKILEKLIEKYLLRPMPLQ